MADSKTPVKVAPMTVAVNHAGFYPASVAVTAGDTVLWQFQEAGHSVVDDGGRFDSGKQDAGGVFQYTYALPGIYPYCCGTMPGMKGLVTVNPAK